MKRYLKGDIIQGGGFGQNSFYCSGRASSQEAQGWLEGAHPTQLTVPIITGKVKLESEKIQPLQVFQKTKTFFEMQTNSEIFLKLQTNLKIQLTI